MNYSQLIQTLIATVVGGLIVIATNWIGTREARRNANKEWYEKNYLLEGIEPLVTYLYDLAIYFHNKSYVGSMQVRSFDTIPVEAIVRLEILFSDSVVVNIIEVSQKLLSNQDKKVNRDASKLLHNACKILLKFREEFLHSLLEKVRTKHYVVNASREVEKLNEIIGILTELAGYKLDMNE